MKADEIRAAIEKKFSALPSITGDPMAWHAEGEQRWYYQTHGLGRVCPEGEVKPVVLNATEEEVAALFFAYLCHYIDEHGPSRLIWRRDPTAVIEDRDYLRDLTFDTDFRSEDDGGKKGTGYLARHVQAVCITCRLALDFTAQSGS